MPSMTVQRWADAQEKFKGVTEIVAVVAVERVRPIIDCELGTKSHIETIAMRQIADITDR